MKSIFNAAVACVLYSALIGLFGGNAFAADLPPRPAPLPPPQAPAAFVPPVYDWTGIYLGINGGWGWGNGKWTVAPNAAFPVGVSSTLNDNGGFVGGTLGANFQTGAFVFGVEGDWDYSGINTQSSAVICNATGTCQTGNNWLATVRGRAGVAFDRVLFYGTAGGAFANVQTTYNGVTASHDQAGWTAGIGAEAAALTGNWTAKLEYLYVNIGSGTTSCSTVTCVAANGAPIPVSVSLTENLLRFGVNYKF